jgi:hypothetical protein
LNLFPLWGHRAEMHVIFKSSKTFEYFIEPFCHKIANLSKMDDVAYNL